MKYLRFIAVIVSLLILTLCNSFGEEDWKSYTIVKFDALVKNPNYYNGKRVCIECYMRTNMYCNSQLFESYECAYDFGRDFTEPSPAGKYSKRFLSVKSQQVILSPASAPLRAVVFGIFQASENGRIETDGWSGYIEDIRRLDVLKSPQNEAASGRRN